MNELQTIVAAYEQIPPDQRAVLATVVHTAGSVYRRSGARLLVTETRRIGVISGGCLENDVEERAQIVLATGEPTLAVYDAIANENILWGLGLGCNGLIQILLEPLNGTPNPLTFMADCLRDRQTGVVATVFRSEGLATPIASHLMRYPNGDIDHSLQDAALIERTIVDAQAAFHLRQSRVSHYDFPTGSADVWIEVMQPPTPILIFGAGQDAIPVAQFAKALGWYVTVVDRRPAYANRDRFPIADEICIMRPENGLDTLSLDWRTAVVVMTHNYFDDLEVLRTLLPSSVPYVGVLGPKRRTDRLLQELQASGIVYSHAQLEKLHAPIGLDIGADTPDAIAVSIVAEIQAVLAQRTAGFLKHRSLPIHQ